MKENYFRTIAIISFVIWHYYIIQNNLDIHAIPSIIYVGIKLRCLSKVIQYNKFTSHDNVKVSRDHRTFLAKEHPRDHCDSARLINHSVYVIGRTNQHRRYKHLGAEQHVETRRGEECSP